MFSAFFFSDVMFADSNVIFFTLKSLFFCPGFYFSTFRLSVTREGPEMTINSKAKNNTTCRCFNNKDNWTGLKTGYAVWEPDT